ncbi:gustatory receptor for sugar taste 64e [Dendroctonus ponderosae]|nr:gustatory receptor for sugar taste 64e [Dendroctonus ponderosae]
MFLLKHKRIKPAKVFLPPALKPSSKPPKSILCSFRLFMRISHIVGMLPQENFSKSPEDLKFKWLSWRAIYSLLIISALLLAVTCCFMHWVLHGSSISGVATAVFYGGSLITVLLFFYLALSWSKLLKSWHAIDRTMAATYGYPEKLDKQIRVLTAVFLTLAIVDYLLSVANKYEHLNYASGYQLTTFAYFNDTFPQLFAYIPFSIGTGIFCTAITVHSNLTWALNDLFIIIASSALAMRFRQISQKLIKERDDFKLFQHAQLSFWRQIREDYDRLTRFCKELDCYISVIVLLSYFMNIFSLLIQLYRSLEFISLPIRKVYLIFSFGYLIFKTTMVSLYAAWINDESKAFTHILNSVDSTLYNTEIRRLLTQISFDKTALTGCKMFAVKRGTILSVASAIVTYELVLIQFSQANLYDTY